MEVLPNLGGTSSNQVNGYYWGVPWESLLRLELGDRIELIKRSGAGSLEKVRFSGPLKIRTLLEMAMDAGVNLYFQSFGAGAIVEGNRVRGMVVENAAGRQALLRSHAHRLLTEITGQSLGRDPQAWQDWWRSIE